jgi:hypothetical protein
MPHMKIRSWKTSAFGFMLLGIYVAKYIWPQHADFFDGFIPIMLAGGLLVAKDGDVSGKG